MISHKQISQWEQQSKKDIEQFKKQQQKLKDMRNNDYSPLTKFFTRIKARYLSANAQEYDKLNRLLIFTNMANQIENYPQVKKQYMTYQIICSGFLIFSIVFPKKYLIKALVSVMVYGFKKNILDGMLTFYLIESMALSCRMDQNEQQLRNILQFHYMYKKFNQTKETKMGEQQETAIDSLLCKIRSASEQYYTFKKLENIL